MEIFDKTNEKMYNNQACKKKKAIYIELFRAID